MDTKTNEEMESEPKPIPYVKFHSDSTVLCPVCGLVELGGENFATSMTHLEYDHEMRVLHVSSETDGVTKRTVAVFGPTKSHLLSYHNHQVFRRVIDQIRD